MNKTTRSTALFLCCAVASSEAALQTIDFDYDDSGQPIVNGQVIDDEYQAKYGLSITVTGGIGYGVAYDTDISSPGDPDLNWPYPSGNNNASTFDNVLIIQENGSVDVNEAFLDVGIPDDNGGGGSVLFDFGDTYLTGFQTDWLDLDEPDGDTYRMIFTDTSTGLSATVYYNEFVTPGDNFHDASIAFSDHSANSLPLITAASLDDADVAPAQTMTRFNQVEFILPGSGAFGAIGIVEAVPEPSAALLAALGGLVLLGSRRRS